MAAVFRAILSISLYLIIAAPFAIAQQADTNIASAVVGRPSDTAIATDIQDGSTPANGPAALTIAMAIELQINTKGVELSQMQHMQALSDTIANSREDVQRAISDAKSVDCKTDANKLSTDFATISKTLNAYFSLSQDVQKVENESLPQIFGNFWAAQPADKCLLLKDEATAQSYDGAINNLAALSKKRREEAGRLVAEIDHLNARIRQILVNQSAISSVTQNLPLILGIIAGAALVIILVIRLFSPELQMEWVASGQVIQFTTVMTLLSALMALGLTGILKEQVLGTLLGGVAGYVLAQGVGRATARATLNAANAANSIPPAAVGAAAGAAAAAVLPAAAASIPRRNDAYERGAGI